MRRRGRTGGGPVGEAVLDHVQQVLLEITCSTINTQGRGGSCDCVS
jgi:hypothetical protein